MQSYIGKAGLCFLLLPLLISLANAKLPEKDQNFQTTDWVALIPKDDLDALIFLVISQMARIKIRWIYCKKTRN
jgi:hypothetical protein